MTLKSTPTLDDVESFWNSRPCNVRHSKAPIGTRQYFDEVEERKYTVEPHIPGFAQFERWRGKRVLEVGCGIGTDTINFARAGAEVVAVDLSEESLAIARTRAEVYGFADQIEFLHGNAEELGSVVGDRQFDLIYSFGVIHHTPNPAAAVRQMRRLVSETTELRLMVYAENSWKRAMIDAGLDQPEAATGCPIAFTYTEASARDLLEGFRITSVTQDHIFPYVVEDYIEHRYVIQPYFQMMSETMFKALESNFGWHLLVGARPD